MSDLFSLKGRRAIVTGGSRGIGKMIARGFLEQGAKVTITARKAAQCEATVKELSSLGEIDAIPIDLSSLDGINAFATAYETKHNALDILVNNAGAAWLEPFDDFSEKGWDKVLDLNLKTPFFLTQRLHGLLKAGASKAKPSKVIHIASIDGQSANNQETYSYQASKSGLIHLTKRMALKLIQDDICVSAIAPGAFASDMNIDARDNAENVAKRIPARRLGVDDDMAGTAIFLASKAGDYIVGATITVDGGISFTRAW